MVGGSARKAPSGPDAAFWRGGLGPRWKWAWGPAQRREIEILKSRYSSETACFEDLPTPVPATLGGALDKRRDLWHIDVVRCARSILYGGFPQGFGDLCAEDEWVQCTSEN